MNILARRTNHERQEICEAYQSLYQKVSCMRTHSVSLLSFQISDLRLDRYPCIYYTKMVVGASSDPGPINV